ncbi:MAG: DNA gyrase inhibitor YacG [Alphaproteobacteria bacterium]
MTDNKVVPLRGKNGACPICDKPTVSDFRPFCCKRCADRDLGKWLKEDYRLPTDEVAGFDGDPIEEN